MSADKIEMRSRSKLLEEIEELRTRLEEAEQTLQAIRCGEVDALIVEGPQGDQVFSLAGVESVYRAIVESMNEAALTVSPQGAILFCNQRFSNLMKKPMHEVIGRELSDFVEVSHHPALVELVTQAQMEPARGRLMLRSADATHVPAQFSASLLDNGTTRCICLVASDLTELEASTDLIRFLREHQQELEDSQRALRESEKRFRTLFSTLIEGFGIIEMMFDADGRPSDYRFLQINPAFEAQTGLQNAQGRRMRELAPDHEAHWFEIFGNVALTGQSVRVVNEAKALGRWFDVSAYRVGGPENRTVAILLNDVTKSKQAEDAVRAAKEKLEERVQERTAELKERAEQLARLSSQLTMTEQRERNRLAQILHDGLQQYLLATKLQVGELIERATDVALKQSANEVEKLLSESIMVSRTLAAELSPRSLHETGLMAGLEWLSRWMFDKHGLKIELVMLTETPVLAEDVKLLLFESIRELLLNVVKHSRTHSAKINLAHTDGRSLEIVVSDNGVGFDPARACEKEGSFGLFSIRERVNLIGGSFEVESSPGKGASFTLRTPLVVDQPLAPMPDAQPDEVHPTGLSCFATPVGKIRILLTDDHAAMREGLARLLAQETDFDVVAQASDGQEAVEFAAKLVPDVILMDISMPRMNGLDATRIIHQEHPDIRIIGLSLYPEAERAKAMLDSGAVYYLSKTTPPSDLKAAIRSCMHQKSHAGTESAESPPPKR